MNDVKLYKHFVERIKPLGKIKRAWFTTFNLDINFFEKYILSAVLGESPDNLRHPVHYENLSALLASNEADLVITKTDMKGDTSLEAKTEVKVFYDFRMLEGNGEKRTTVELYPINPQNFTDRGVNRFYNGVFHPKVILLETHRGEIWLMVSSANLTFGGWSHNREAFFFDKVNTYNLRLLGDFFEGFINPIYKDKFAQNGLFLGFGKNRPDTNPTNWEFTSSFNQKGLLDLLRTDKNDIPLRVWSPYFAKDLKDVIATLKNQRFTGFTLVPAQNKNGKIDIVQEDILKDSTIALHQDKLPSEAFDSLVHAKVWLTPEKLGIGSWNMTHAGLGLDKNSKNNIEAGVVIYLNSEQYEQIATAYPTVSINDPKFSTADDLDDAEDELSGYRFQLSMDVVLDWNKHEVRIEFPDFRTLGKPKFEGAKMRLPGMGERFLFEFRETKSVQIGHNYKHFLKDRSYALFSNSDTVLFRGFLRETGLENRPVNCFENLNDLFKGWVSDKPEARTELHIFGSEGITGEFEDVVFNHKSVSPSNAWFSTFYAYEAMLARIKEVNSLASKVERILKLKQIGYVIPGCFNELKTFLNKELSEYRTSKESLINPIYLWFKIEKANSIFKYYDDSLPRYSQIDNLGTLQNISLQTLLAQNKAVNQPKKLLKAWENFIAKRLEHQE